MAGRPTKAGLDYFDLDCRMNEKVRLIQAEYGLKGFAVVVKLYQKIYGERGYYCEWNEESALLFASENGASSRAEYNLIHEIVAACIRRDIFSQRLFEEYGILTSEGVQKRYLNATARRESVELKKEYLLISVGENPTSADGNSIIADNNSINVCRNSQSRVDKSRVDKSRVDKSRVDKSSLTVSKDTVRQTQSVRQVIEEWNKLEAYGIACVAKLTADSKRYGMLIARLNQYGVDNVLKAIENIKHSDFLQGKNAKGWMITFDWFVKPNNFPKVLEGNYNNGSQSVNQSPTAQMLDRSYDMMMSWVEKKEAQGQ